MTKKLPEIDRKLLDVLVRGAEKTFDNAEKLYFEAEILAKAGALARALCLHQISLEECSKVENLGAWATSLLSGLEADQQKILSAFRRHSSKNKSNAYLLGGSKAEKDAKARGDWKAALEEFRKFQTEFHEASNNAKNASLYVDWKDVEFVSPTENITQEMLSQIVDRNETFLGHAQNSLNMLKRLNASPEVLQDLIVEFVETAKRLHAEKPNDPQSAFKELTDKFLAAGLDRLESKSR